MLMSSSHREKGFPSKSCSVLLSYISNCSKKDFIARVFSVVQCVYIFFSYSVTHSLHTNNSCIYIALAILPTCQELAALEVGNSY